MRKATKLEIEEVKNLKENSKGEKEVPAKFEIYIKQDPEELRLERIAKLEAELQKLTKPTDEELIELGKAFHLFYMLGNDLKGLKGGK